MAAFCFRKYAVIGFAKTHIMAVPFKIHLREFLRKVPFASIVRIIVYHKYLGLQVCTGFYHRVQALLQEIFYVVVYYDDGKLQMEVLILFTKNEYLSQSSKK